ncbi:MAG: hypothetical protein AAFU53_07130 [Cyanobacteria bacterium J06632_3]
MSLTQLLTKPSSQPLSLTLLADYGLGDLAFQEVKQKLRSYLPSLAIDCLSLPPFATLTLGFMLAQLALNEGLPGRVYYHNCAPRKDDLKSRTDNDGEGLTYLLLPNDVKVIGVNSGYSLSFLKHHALLIKEVNVPTYGSQFRSRDIFPAALAQLLAGDESLLGADLLLVEDIPEPPLNQLLLKDGYGNLKLSIPSDVLDLTPGEETFIRIGNSVNRAICADGSFSVPDGTLAFSPGSSGWRSPDGKTQTRWMELFLRGGSAWELFGRPPVGTPVERLKPWEEIFSGYKDSFSWSCP